MSERIKADYQKFGDEQLQKNQGLVIKRLQLVAPEKAIELGVVGVEGVNGPVFISDQAEDGKGPGNLVENYRRYVYRVGEVLNSQNPNNHYGGGLFIDRLSRQGDYGWIAPSSGEEGKWIGWAEPRGVRNGGSVAESLRIVKAQPICWNSGVEEHFKEINSGFVYESDGYLFPLCDLDQHPIQIQPRKLLGEIDSHLIWIDQRKVWDKDLRYRFSVANNGQVQFSPVKG